jgi:Domain of unknown function (DUF1707)
MTTGFNVRVGDADRDAVAAQLRDHYADGRLTLDELNERLDLAFAAKTQADLNAVTRDLPHVARPTAAAGVSPAGPISSPGSGWDYGSTGGQRSWGGRSGPFAPIMSLVWLCVIIGCALTLGIGGGDKPLAIVLIIAVLAFLRRLFGGGRRGGGPRTPRGPRGPRGPGRRF